MPTVRVGRDGVAYYGRRKLTFPLSLAGATVTVLEPKNDEDEDDTEE